VLTALAVTSWTAYYPNAHADAVVHPDVLPIVRRVGARCITTNEQDLADLPDVALLRARFLSANPSDVEGWSEDLEVNRPRTVQHAVPLLVSQGLADEIVRPTVTEAFVGQQCAAGATIELDRYPGVGHFQVRTVAATRVVDWLIDRLHGEPAASGCSTRTLPGAP
jgi:hypothetical protein